MTTTPPEPERAVRLDPSNLRGIAHPLRVQALGWLRRHGPATATQLAQHLGQSSGSTSYHLRQLAAYGFIVEDTSRGNGRERWWRAAHQSTRYDSAALAGDPAQEADEATRAAGAEYLRAVGRVYADRISRFTDSIETLTEDHGPRWAQASTLSDWPLQLTAEQAGELIEELERLADRYRQLAAEAGPGSRPVALQVQVFPLPGQ